jgi:hypothetical protein
LGLTLEFYAAAHCPLFDAVIDLDFDTIESLQVPGRFADLSLHITPADLDLLSLEVCNTLAKDPMRLREHLDMEGLYVDEPDRGAFVVRQGWIQLIASLEHNSITAVVSAWCEEMSRIHDDPDISTTPEAVEALRALVETCQYAHSANSEVVHVWFA